jgi:hypothetical protein
VIQIIFCICNSYIHYSELLTLVFQYCVMYRNLSFLLHSLTYFSVRSQGTAVELGGERVSTPAYQVPHKLAREYLPRPIRYLTS